MANATCFWPDGSPAYQTVPCGIGTTTHCCYDNNYCLSNNLCLDQYVLTLYRGSCTSKVWAPESCSLYCLDPEVESRAIGVLPCIGLDGSRNGTFVCDQWDCMDPADTFRLEPGLLVMNERLRTELGIETDTTPSSSPTSRLGLTVGLALGLPLLALLIFLLAVRLRHRHSTKFAYQGQNVSKPSQIWPLPAPAPPGPFLAPDPGCRTFQPPKPAALPSYSSMVLSELSDGNPYTNSTARSAHNSGREQRPTSRMEWEAVPDRVRRELDSQAEWGAHAR